MALNKFYDAINATLTLPYNDSFTKAEKRKGRDFESRKDEESNQAMFEIAETFLQTEDFNNAIKFYDRLNRRSSLMMLIVQLYSTKKHLLIFAGQLII